MRSSRHRTALRRIVTFFVLAALPLTAEVRTLTILHTNDLHSRLSPLDNHYGGFAYLVSAIRHEREGCIDCILVNAGDLAQGSPVSTIYKGVPVFEIANLFGFDAATLGNHDFDYGWQQALHFVEMSKYPIVSSNIVNGKGQLLTPAPWVILKINGLRVGIIGAMTDDLHNLTFPAALGDYHTTPSVETVRKYAAELRGQCDLVVLVAHINPAEEKAFLGEPDVPVIVSGHIHSGLEQAMSSQGHVLVRVKSYGEELGRLELKVDTEKKAPVSWTWKKIPIDSEKVKPAPDVAAQVKVWEDKVSTVVDQPIGVSNRQLAKPEVKVLLEEAMKAATGADFAFINTGGVRDILPKGQVLLRYVWNIMPFDDMVVYGTFKGRELPAVVTAGHQIDPDRDYKLAVSDFTAANQETQENLRTKGLQFPGDAGLLRDALAELIRKRKVIE
jgi:2',3'-cyclic-nucleotide 2'-phosphodiesterase (5'-nucleotidase family)